MAGPTYESAPATKRVLVAGISHQTNVVFAGFPYADVPEAGVAFSAVTTGDLELARGAVRR